MNLDVESKKYYKLIYTPGFPSDSDGKESACNARDPGSIPGLGRSSGEGNGNPLQYSCLENSMDRGAWRPTVYGQKELDISEQLKILENKLRLKLLDT